MWDSDGNIIQAHSVRDVHFHGPPPGAGPGVLQQLPVPPAVFVDRDPILAWMGERVAAAWGAGRPAFMALHGPAGVGVRSVLRRYWVDNAGLFADGVLRVRFGEGQSVAEALADVLADFEVDRRELPASEAARQGRLLTVTHSKNVLVVLEGVESAAQVEPFLVNSPRSAVVVLSRAPIRHLLRLGFQARAVTPLEERFGLELFDRVLGVGWHVEAGVEPAALVRACGGYPLAMQATAAQIAGAPEWEVADLVRAIARRGLEALDPESQEHVRVSFEGSYLRLSPAAARAYRLVVGYHPGSTVLVDGAAAMLGVAEAEAVSALVALSDARLLERTGADTFEFHTVAHWHARDRAERDEPRAEVAAAVERVVGWYLEQAVAHDRVLSSRPRLGGLYQVAATVRPTRAQAWAWLERRRPNLRAAVTLAERFQMPELVWQLCEALWGVYHVHRHYDEWIATHRSGVEAAVQLGDARVRMRMTSQLGSALLNVADLDEAAAAFAESHRAADEAGDPVGRQSALEWSGKVAARRGRTADALAFFDQSWHVAATEAPEHERPRMFALLSLQRARVLLAATEHEQAAAAARQALAHFQDTGETDNTAKSLLVLAQAAAGLGDPAAAGHARAAVDLFQEDKSASGEADALEVLLAVAPDDEVQTRLTFLRDQAGG
ncbi:hypothetical protein ACOBQX_02940 [Actinokineospora sp. G85]|uniref:hypothetical protein n=1 Tax=Actinokineospora sp. G85 TaxID=3406626 RepID=UPI003C74BE7D